MRTHGKGSKVARWPRVLLLAACVLLSVEWTAALAADAGAARDRALRAVMEVAISRMNGCGAHRADKR
jgi:hypothetical protein